MIPIIGTELGCQKNNFPLQKQIRGSGGRASLITDTASSSNSNEFPLRIETSGSKRINSVAISAATVSHGSSALPPSDATEVLGNVFFGPRSGK